MKTKIVLLSALFLLGCLSASLAQNIPSYIPTNGLVGWYPFNGNANDESGNGNNQIENNATLSADRFMNSDKAYFFNGIDDYISVGNISSYNFTSSFSIGCWINRQDPLNNIHTRIVDKGIQGTSGGYSIDVNPASKIRVNGFSGFQYSQSSIIENQWIHITYVLDVASSTSFIYINGVLDATYNVPIPPVGTSSDFWIGGASPTNNQPSSEWFHGTIDDIAIWNRALTQQEITNLYNASSCANNLSISPANPSQSTGSNAALNASTSDPNPSFVWQSDLGLGFQNLSNYGQYSGVNTDSLVVSNLQLRNHQQAFRVISTSGNCVDTSAVATISLTDTCLVSQYESVTTDTIRILVTGMNPADYLNTIRIYPNPATQGTQLKIDFGNFSVMDGYQLRIENALGQQVFQTSIDNPGDTVNLSSLGGSGVYFVRILNPLGNTSVLRKIMLQ